MQNPQDKINKGEGTFYQPVLPQLQDLAAKAKKGRQLRANI
jgi:hypothetical protein